MGFISQMNCSRESKYPRVNTIQTFCQCNVTIKIHEIKFQRTNIHEGKPLNIGLLQYCKHVLCIYVFIFQVFVISHLHVNLKHFLLISLLKS